MTGSPILPMKADSAANDLKPLPLFRRDLQLYPGPNESDGSPTYNLYDPVRAQFFKLNWAAFLIFRCLLPGMNLPQLIKAIEAESTLKVDPNEIKLLFNEAIHNKLLEINYPSAAIKAEAEKAKMGWFLWLIYHYLYIRVPLCNPDKFLKRTLPYVEPLFSPFARKIYLVLICCGLFLLTTRFEEFLHTFTYFFTFEGLLAYGLGIMFVKVVHELSHAYTAKHYNIYVPAIGVAFIVFWPVLYTDVTESWKLQKRKHRLAISFAGIMAELIIAGISTLGWVLTQPGTLQSVFFVIASVTWVSTLVINLNPALRFDGYYLLMDIWQVDNLQNRAFAVTRWKLRKWLFDMDLPPPEEPLSHKRIAGMIIYTTYTWLYRVVLYTTIAVFVYEHFTKVLGIFLFILEIGIFLIWPVVSEMTELYRFKTYLSINRRSVITTTLIVLFFAWFVLPFPHKESYPALTIPDPSQTQVLYVPVDSSIEALDVKRDDVVTVGQPLVKLYSKALLIDLEIEKVNKEIAEKDILISSVAKKEEDRAQIGEEVANKAAVSEKIKELEKLYNELTITASVSGNVFAWDERLALGQFVAKGQELGKIANLKDVKAVAFVPETYIKDLKIGQQIEFQLQNNFEKIPGTISKIIAVNDHILEYPQLASINKGGLPVIQDPPPSKKLRLVDTYYMVIIDLDDNKASLKIGQMGDVHARGPWRSKLMTMLHSIQSIFWREGTL